MDASCNISAENRKPENLPRIIFPPTQKIPLSSAAGEPCQSVNIKMLCYLFLPLYGAVMYGYRGQGYSAVVKGVLWMFPAMCISLYIPSISTAMMLFLMFVLILSFAVGKGWFAVSVKYTLAGIWGIVLLLPAAVCAWVIRTGADYQAARPPDNGRY